MASAITLSYITISWFLTSYLLLFVIILFRNYIKKQTVGTIMLIQVYFLFFISRSLSSVAYTLQITAVSEVAVEIVTIVSSLSSTVAITFLYLFSCRHILKDSEPIRAFTTFLFFTLIGSILSLTIYDSLYTLDNPMFTRNYLTPELFTISFTRVFVFLQIGLQTYVFLRVIIKSFVISRKTTQYIRKRGFILLGWGLALYFVGGLLGGIFYSIDGLGDGAGLAIWIFRNFIIIAAYSLMYMGWILPDWYRKLIRKKTWIENELKVIST